VEKSLKAILVMKDIEFRKTHDIRELLDIISDNNLEIPSWFQELDAWTPFAVEYRYEELPDGPVYPVPRKDLAANAFSIIKFVEQQIS
jgi:HEPN domain-containing protein